SLFVAAAPLAPVSAQQGRPAQAQGEKPAAPAPAPAPGAPSPDKTTKHRLALPGGGELAFTATAGTIRLTTLDGGAPVADMAYIAFIRDDAGDAARRPVTFAMNGGPGYASAWLNLGALGPWRLPMDAAAAYPSAPPALTPNAESWLPFTDLVFLDPAGTGYSRALSEDARKSLWSVNGDLDSLATTIRRWLAANERGGSPVFIAGESYGGFRAPKIAHRLQTDQGVGVAGLVLVSPVLDFGRFNATSGLLDHVARLPSYAAARRGLTKPQQRADLADVEAYAKGPFLADLMAGPRDAEAMARLTARVSELTGIAPDVVRRYGARIPMGAFLEEFRRPQGAVVSMYDALVTGIDPSPYSERPDAQDQMRLGLHAPITQAMVRLYARELEQPMPGGRYFFMSEQAGRQWDWGNRARQEATGDLASAMALDPRMRTLVAHGLTDLVTPYFETQMVLDQLPPLGDPARLRFVVYQGGHMFYSEEGSRQRFRDDARAMIEAATAR
ncbi:MAG TPA: peptidase S10, partial [Beijerinckiaceae bacterium]